MGTAASPIRVPDRVRMGIVGLGAVAQAVHLPLLERLRDRFSIWAISDLSASLVDTIGERYRVPEARRSIALDGLLAIDGLDALLILTSGSHGDAVVAGLDRGLPVFAEKPLAWTLAEADAMGARLASNPSGKLQVGYMKLHDPAVDQALAVVRDTGRFGSIRSIEVCVLHPTGTSQLAHAHLFPPPTDIPADILARLVQEQDRLRIVALGPAAAELGPLYSDIVLGSIVHDLALIRAFGGDPLEIDAVDVWPARRWPPSVAIVGRLAHEGRFDIRWHFLPDYPAYREEFRVVGDGITIELGFPSPYLLNAPTDLRITDLHEGGRRDSRHRSVVEAFEEELLAFHALVTDGRLPRASLLEGRADIVTSQRIVARRAAQLGLPIDGEAAR
jgi:predicted dehydrogenase